jgi:hypothetical protein
MLHEESGNAPAQDVPQCQAHCACLASPLACQGQCLAGRVKGTAQRMGDVFLHTDVERLLTADEHFAAVIETLRHHASLSVCALEAQKQENQVAMLLEGLTLTEDTLLTAPDVRFTLYSKPPCVTTDAACSEAKKTSRIWYLSQSL